MRPDRRTRPVRGRVALLVHLILSIGFAWFVALVGQGRTGLDSVTAAWLAVFGVTLAGLAAWLLVSTIGIARVTGRPLGQVAARAVWTALPLAVPIGLAVAAYASDAVNHRLTQTDDLLWIWGSAIGVWVAAQVISVPLALDRVAVRPADWARRLLAGAREVGAPRLTFPLVLAQFIALRALLAFLWQPFGFFERGSDVGAFEQRARLALRGLQPYTDYWVEYPPAFPWAATGLKLLSVHFGGGEAAFQVLFSLFILLFEAGTLVLIHRIALRVYDPSRALAAAVVYAFLFFPLYIANRHFEAMAVFFLLLGIYAVIEGRRHSAAVALTLGVLTKLFPLAGFPGLLAGAGWGMRARALALTAAVLTGALLPLAIRGREFFLASIQNMAARPAWETLWALADGYFSFGSIHRFREDPGTALEFNYVADLPPALWPAIAAVLVAILAYLAFRRTPITPAAPVWSAGVALAAFAIYLKGWSPQFMVWFLPFVVIAYPGGRGFLIATALSALALLESPGYFVAWSDRSWVLWVIVITRTLAIAAIGVMFLRRLWALDNPTAVRSHRSD